MKRSYKCLSGFQIRILAMIFMVIDHVGRILFPSRMVFCDIGRIAFPLFVFLLVEGAMHSKNFRKYLFRLLLAAILSEIPFDLALHHKFFDWNYQNVMWTLLLGLFMILLLKKYQSSRWLCIVIVLVCAFAGGILNFDYGLPGILLIFAFFVFYDKWWIKCIALGLVAVLISWPTQLFSLVAILPILLYNGTEGPAAVYQTSELHPGRKVAVQTVFYLFYPVHLLILACIYGVVFK